MYRGELDRQFEQKETWEQRPLTGNIAEELSMVRKLNRLLLGFLTMNCGKEEPHMVRAVAE